MKLTGARTAAAILGLLSLSIPAAAQTASPAHCRALKLQQCSPDLCETLPLPGATRTDEGNWLAGDATDRLARVSLSQRARQLTINWDGRRWTAPVARQWASGNVTGAAGTMREALAAGEPGPATYQITWLRTGHGLLFSMIVDPTAEQDDYYVLNGACEPGASLLRPGRWKAVST